MEMLHALRFWTQLHRMDPAITLAGWLEIYAQLQVNPHWRCGCPNQVMDPDSRRLLVISLASAMVANDSDGNTRLIKKGSNQKGRDDVSAALCLVAGAWERSPKPDEAEDLIREPILV